jgi:cap1 methyltransferase
MGFEEGKGLGKSHQGISKPIDESNQIGTRGLGFQVKNFEKRVESWNYDDDPVTEIETPIWIENRGVELPALSLLIKNWKKIGKKKVILDDEYEFCSSETLKQVLECKVSCLDFALCCLL